MSRDSEPNRGWYAHGTVYLLSRRRTSHRLGDPSRMWNRERNKPIACYLVLAVADPEKNLGGAEKYATTTCVSIKTPHKREI